LYALCIIIVSVLLFDHVIIWFQTVAAVNFHCLDIIAVDWRHNQIVWFNQRLQDS